MKITFLGTGTSTGIPEIGCNCPVCLSSDSRDKRLRTSALIEYQNKYLLIDCSPDFRMQALTTPINQIDAVLLTHEHYDHVGGLDDLRPFCSGKDMDIYAEENVVEAIQSRIPYVFREHKYPGIPKLILHTIHNQPFEVEGIKVIPIRLMHACLPIVGFRIANIGYLTDLKTIPETEFEKLKGLDILIINALKKEEHLSHASLGEALTYIERIQPKKSYLIHASHRLGLHSEIEKILPANVSYAYDGLVVEI